MGETQVLVISDDQERASHLIGLGESVTISGQDGDLCQFAPMIVKDNITVDEFVGKVSNLKWDVVVIAHRQGLMILEELKRFRPSLGVIYVSIASSIQETVRAFKLGIDDYFSSVLELEGFATSLGRVISRFQMFDEGGSVAKWREVVATGQLMSSAGSQEQLRQLLLHYLQRELKAPFAVLFNGRTLEKEAHIGNQDSYEEMMDYGLASLPGFSSVLEGATNGIRFLEKSPLVPGFLFMKLEGVEEDHLVVVLAPSVTEFSKEWESRMEFLRTQWRVTDRTLSDMKSVQSLVVEDEVTGLYNTRALQTYLEREVASAQSQSRAFALLFIDLDHFKKVNDQHGHLVGTQVLKEFATCLRTITRESDHLFRYGGDEFIVVLSDARQSVSIEDALRIAERLRSKVEASRWAGNLNLSLTISVGVALFPTHAKSREEILKAADFAMYGAKRRARNSVSLSGDRPSA